ncbi:MAG: caspase family protein [Chitinophagaceae bacterium]|nr:MAG: caspase family protein [Chitinophagaceae bacterium]
MIRLFLLTVSIFCVSVVAQAKTYRALIIGIDQYKPPANVTAESSRSLWRNLSGCVNDASAMRDLVVAKFGFASRNITTLFNTEAKRERIIGELKKLISSAEKGDVVFIYYAGHGKRCDADGYF